MTYISTTDDGISEYQASVAASGFGDFEYTIRIEIVTVNTAVIFDEYVQQTPSRPVISDGECRDINYHVTQTRHIWGGAYGHNGKLQVMMDNNEGAMGSDSEEESYRLCDSCTSRDDDCIDCLKEGMMKTEENNTPITPL